MMPTVEIVYFSGEGHTEAIANSVLIGVQRVEGIDASLMTVSQLGRADDAQDPCWLRLDHADAIVFGSPTYMGTVAADFKKFMDQTGARWYARSWMDKLAAGFTLGGGLSGDKQGTLQALQTFASQHGMVWVSMGVGVQDPKLDRLSSSIGLMCQADNAPAAETPPKQDHDTAEAFGERFARATRRWASSKE
jgi:NAD(P)H dehydrogenase (quinone)